MASMSISGVPAISSTAWPGVSTMGWPRVFERRVDHTRESGLLTHCCQQSAETVGVVWNVLCSAGAIDMHPGDHPM
jgi:hypothetical protein